ncbi:pyridoxal-dependent decarboxylase, exosortase A system-associated [Croceicoccus naphthovorans]|uniref:Diaminopimelate decarboxylase n=1 Tax=Croceicoccus naphthovorans TaxID=1348774 RepID=A0A0G3XH07_9SPHN|nr:pyridoxal-dependent decarboxylase, exosortase A system-associated [Croceicoccus naphthovorans]AKM09921.1 diaminopimelate decarboxylase [Croceicoccus naphthovorans]MBB3990932.1 diaminopimelate decarboxylase [Croceicoccus naphthovorans]
MKAMGPIPAGFGSVAGELVIEGKPASHWVAQAGGTPLFVYDAAMLTARVAQLRRAMPDRLAIHYAMKANPFAPLLAHMAGLVDGFDVASAGELQMAMGAGVAASRISFAGPGKSDAELEAAISASVTLNLESAGELRRALQVADRIGKSPRLAIRVNPDFDLKGSGMKMGGGAKPFGIDAETVPPLVQEIIAAGAEWRGFHIFAGSQALSADSVIETQRETVALAVRLAEAADAPLPHCNIGGGFGIPYFPGDAPLDVDAVGAALGETLAGLSDVYADTQFAIELGRWLVGEAGVYLTRVLDVKQSHGETFVVVDGGLHHQLAASGNFGTVVRRNYPVAVANRMDEAASGAPQSIVGRLCTPIDRLADKVSLPMMQEGDLVAIFCAGAYGASASPAEFLGHGPAHEVLVAG